MNSSRYRNPHNYELEFEPLGELRIIGNWESDQLSCLVSGYPFQVDAEEEARWSLRRDLYSLLTDGATKSQLRLVWSLFGTRFLPNTSGWNIEAELERALDIFCKEGSSFVIQFHTPTGRDDHFPLVRDHFGTRESPKFGVASKRKNGQPMIIGFDNSKNPLHEDCEVWVVDVFETLQEAIAVAQNLICDSMRDFYFQSVTPEHLAGFWSKCGSGYLVLGGWVPAEGEILELSESVVREMEM